MPKNLDPERLALDLAGFAQEFLRRNPAYRSCYAAIMRGAQPHRATAEQEAMARSWGLSFSMCA